MSSICSCCCEPPYLCLIQWQEQTGKLFFEKQQKGNFIKGKAFIINKFQVLGHSKSTFAQDSRLFTPAPPLFALVRF